MAPVSAAAPRDLTVDVVIPYYRDQPMLDRILAALRHQVGAPRGLRVIVADDGSPTPPRVPPEVTGVRQEDLGFRASAARHLGATAGSGEILLFLDGDTVPGPGYVAELCSVLAGQPDLLVVARRRYGRFAEATADAAASAHPAADAADEDADTSAAGAAPAHPAEPVEILPDPLWPASFYAETDNLTRGDDTWRGVLSAACGMHRRLYELAGGFDPGIVGYGGEDWDLAWRCDQAGGRLLHVPDAVAWHDGPDWSGRGADTAAERARRLREKNAETARLAPLIASPLTRPPGAIFALPSIAVHVPADAPDFSGTGTAAATCASLMTWGDVAVTVSQGGPDEQLIAELFRDDPRVSIAAPGRWDGPGDGSGGGGPRRRPPVLVDLHRPCALGTVDARRLRALCPPVGCLEIDDDDGRTLATVRSSRAVAREQEWGDAPGGPVTVALTSLADARHETVGFGSEGEPEGAGLRLERVLGGW